MGNYKSFLLNLIFICLFIILNNCMPDRTPPAPVEFERPEFFEFDSAIDSSFAVSLNAPIKIIFNEEMNLSTFKEGFTLLNRDNQEVFGTFSQESFKDTIKITDDSSAVTNKSRIIFNPSANLTESELYNVEINFLLRDNSGTGYLLGNQITLDTTWSASTYFFTEGGYSQNGFYQLAVLEDRSDAILIYDNFTDISDSTGGLDNPISIISIGEGNNAYVLVSERTTSSTVALYSVSQKQIIDHIPVGVGADQLISDGNSVYCALTSEEAITKINNIGSNNDTIRHIFHDFKVRNIAVGNDYLFVTSDDRSNPGEVRILSKNDLSQISVIDTLLTDRRSGSATVLNNYLFVTEDGSNIVGIWDFQNNVLEKRIALPTGRNQALVSGSFSNEGFALIGNSSGWIYKIDANTLNITDSIHASTSEITDLSLVPGNKIVLAAIPDEKKVLVLSVKSLKKLYSINITNNMEVFDIINRKTEG